MHVGIAGTGKMGTAIARNLLDRGYRVAVWNIDAGMMEAVVAAGATPSTDLQSLVRTVDVAIAMLWGDEVARDVSLGQIIPSARPGQLVIESSTLSPQMYDTLAGAAAQRGVNFLACPVFGSVDNARNGTLTIYPGGSSEAFEQGRELLSAMASAMTFTGSPSASGHLKLASNSVLGVAAGAIGELLGILTRAGVDRNVAVNTLMNALERVATKRQQLLDGDTAPRFSAGALAKDLRLAEKSRQNLGINAPLMECALAEFERAMTTGIAGEDYIAAAIALSALKP